MNTINKKQIAFLGLVAITLIPALSSCDKQEVIPASPGTGFSTRNDLTLAAAPVEENKPVALKPEELNQIREIFGGIKSSLYSLEIEEEGQAPVRLGSAAITDLHQVGSYYSDDYSSERKVKVKVSRIVTRIFTRIIVKKLLDDENALAQFHQVENILNTAAAR